MHESQKYILITLDNKINFSGTREKISIQCIKLCVYSHINAVKTQQISQILSLYNKQHYVIYNNYMFRPYKRAIIRLFTEPSDYVRGVWGDEISPQHNGG